MAMFVILLLILPLLQQLLLVPRLVVMELSILSKNVTKILCLELLQMLMDVPQIVRLKMDGLVSILSSHPFVLKFVAMESEQLVKLVTTVTN